MNEPLSSAERVEVFRASKPRGKVTTQPLPKLAGGRIEPMTWAQLGLTPPPPPAERQVA